MPDEKKPKPHTGSISVPFDPKPEDAGPVEVPFGPAEKPAPAPVGIKFRDEVKIERLRARASDLRASGDHDGAMALKVHEAREAKMPVQQMTPELKAKADGAEQHMTPEIEQPTQPTPTRPIRKPTN